MADLAIDVRPRGDDAFSVACTLGSVRVALAFRWMSRLGLWACTPDSGPQQLVHPGGRILTDPRVVPGVLVWQGTDGYAKEDLGTSLRLVWLDV